jgi:hypothetical protein
VEAAGVEPAGAEFQARPRHRPRPQPESLVAIDEALVLLCAPLRLSVVVERHDVAR